MEDWNSLTSVTSVASEESNISVWSGTVDYDGFKKQPGE